MRNEEKILREDKEECLKALKYWETFKSSKLKERETILLDLHEVELNEETEKDKKRKVKC